ncbi:MAG: ABC transporter permease [Phycisphaeraceae bacterium]|nr:MAG: ABC transporter permease [Phycisphaeraceae bacterium]
MITQTLTIARNALVESLRQPVMLLLVLLCGLMQVFNTWSAGFAMGLEDSGEVEGDNKLLLDIGLATVFVCGTILAAFIATATLSREIENKTVLTVVSKPIGRPLVILGKYLGVSGAILLAVSSMMLFLLICIRHGVLSTASDDPDMPVITLGLAAVVIPLALAAWCNFFYNWNFPQVAVMLILPCSLIAYLLALKLNAKWEWQDLSKEFKPQITTACLCLALGMLVLTAVALAASTRLTQTLTIFLSLGVFLSSLLSNYFVGRYAFKNAPVGMIVVAEPAEPTHAPFDRPGHVYALQLRLPPNRPLPAGTSLYFGQNSNGFDLAVPAFPPFKGDPDKVQDTMGPDTPPGLIVTSAQGDRLTVELIGNSTLGVRRPPAHGDYAFLEPTRTNYVALALWGAFPNTHYFWLLDAVSQNQVVPWSHVGLIGLYAAAQIAVLLALAVVLFQKRDVG